MVSPINYSVSGPNCLALRYHFTNSPNDYLSPQ